MRLKRLNTGLIRFTGMALVVAVVAVACGSSGRTPRIVYITPAPGPTNAAGDGSAAPTTPPAKIGEILVTSAAPDGKWKVTFKKPLVAGLSDAVGTRINDAITRQINDYIAAFTSSNLPNVAKDAPPNQLEGDFAVALNSSEIISLRFTRLTTISGQEGKTGTPGSLNFLVSNAKTLTLSDLFSDPAKAASTLAMKTHSALVTTLGTELTWDGKAPSIDFFSGAWAIAPSGLEFTWPQGQIASSAAGMPSAIVQWADLKPLLKPDSPVAVLAK
jgi:hypothetical protein